MSSTDDPGARRTEGPTSPEGIVPTEATNTTLVAFVDDPLADLLEEVRAALGEAIVDVLLKPGDDLWVRVRTDSCRSAADKRRTCPAPSVCRR